jgi:hypothetical protein
MKHVSASCFMAGCNCWNLGRISPCRIMTMAPLSCGFQGHLTLPSGLLIMGLHNGWQLWLPALNTNEAEVFDWNRHTASGQGVTLTRIWTGLHYHRDSIHTYEPVTYKILHVIPTPMWALNIKQQRKASLFVFFNYVFTIRLWFSGMWHPVM